MSEVIGLAIFIGALLACVLVIMPPLFPVLLLVGIVAGVVQARQNSEAGT